MQMNKGDILGHEFCGIVDQVGPGAKGIEVGKRYVVSFQIACGDVRPPVHSSFLLPMLTRFLAQCFYCKQKLSSQCEMTNSNTMTKAMYGGRTAGIFGYSHLTGGFAGGQAEYVRVPLGDANLLAIPDDVPDEKGKFSHAPVSAMLHVTNAALTCVLRQLCISRMSCPRHTMQSRTRPYTPATMSPSSASAPLARWPLRMRSTKVQPRSFWSTRSRV